MLGPGHRSQVTENSIKKLDTPHGLFLFIYLFHFRLGHDQACVLKLYVTWVVNYVSMICHVSFSLYLNKPSAWLEASRTQGLCVFLLGQTEI